MTLKEIGYHTSGRKHQANETRLKSACEAEQKMRFRESALAACISNGLSADLGQAIVRLVLEEV